MHYKILLKIFLRL